MANRRDVYLKAREYVAARTPFHQLGRLKGVGIDCVGIVLCVGQDLGLQYSDGRPIHGDDYLGYDLFPLPGQMHNEAKRIFAARSSMLPGDILTIGDPRDPLRVHHMALVSSLGPNTLGMIHAYGSIGKVAEHIIDQRWNARITGIYGYTGLTD